MGERRRERQRKKRRECTGSETLPLNQSEENVEKKRLMRHTGKNLFSTARDEGSSEIRGILQGD